MNMVSKIIKKYTPEVPEELKYRYFCDACTGIAFKSPGKKNPGVSICQSCGKSIGQDKPENYIPL